MGLRSIWAFVSMVGCIACAPAEPDLLHPVSKDFTSNVIYGDDNRKESYEIINPQLQEIANSTAAVIKAQSLVLNQKGNFKLLGKNFGRYYKLCKEEQYREQDMAAFCTGVLVAPDKVLTAGHCFAQANECVTARFVFDFKLKAPNHVQDEFHRDQIYFCKKILKQRIDEEGFDFALIQLDRDVVDRTPVELNQKNDIGLGQQLAVLGYPAGLPLKIADNAFVRENSNPIIFKANLDAYQGNSGSPVVNVDTGKLEGLLIRGNNDFIAKGKCKVSVKCSDYACSGEGVVRSSLLHNEIKNVIHL